MKASFDTSGLFSGFEGATSENTESSTFEIKEGPIQGLELWNHITGWLAAIMGLFGAPFNVSSDKAINSGAQTRGTRTHITDTLTTLARALVMAVMLHYVWLTLGSFPYNRVASTNTNGQPETFGGSTDAEDRLALAAVPAAEKWNRGSNSLVSVMVDSGVSGHYFDDTLIRGLRSRLDNYQALAIRRWITTAEGHQLKEAGQELPRGHSIGAQGLKRLTTLSVLAGPDTGWDLFSVKQDGALSGGESLSGTSECGKPREQPESHGEASPASGVPQDGALEHPEQPMSFGCEHVEAPFARLFPLQHHGPLRHQVTPEATRAGNATQSIKERNDNDCTRLVEIATDSTLSGGWDYTPRRSLRISRIRLMKRSRLWNMPVPRPMIKCIRWERKRK